MIFKVLGLLLVSLLHKNQKKIVLSFAIIPRSENAQDAYFRISILLDSYSQNAHSTGPTFPTTCPRHFPGSPSPGPYDLGPPSPGIPNLPGSPSTGIPISRDPYPPVSPSPGIPIPESPIPGPPFPGSPSRDPHPGLSRTRPHRRALPPPGGAAACPPCLRALVAAAPAPPPRRRSRAAGDLRLCLRKNKMAARSVCRAGSAAGRALLWGPRPSVSHRAPRGQRGGEPGRASGGPAVWSGCRARCVPARKVMGTRRCGAVRAGRGGGQRRLSLSLSPTAGLAAERLFALRPGTGV